MESFVNRKKMIADIFDAPVRVSVAKRGLKRRNQDKVPFKAKSQPNCCAVLPRPVLLCILSFQFPLKQASFHTELRNQEIGGGGVDHSTSVPGFRKGD